MVNNIPVNGWPQLKDLEAVQPTLDRLDKIEAWKRTVKEETFTGDDITIENALALPARSLKTVINAIQDLHGYDKPWAGGAGKNKLPMTVSGIKAANTAGTWSGNAYTLNNTTFEILTDSADNVTGFKINTGSGGASDTAVLRISENITLPSGNYKFNGCTDGSESTYFIQLRKPPTFDIHCYANERDFTYSEPFTYAGIAVLGGASLTNKTVYPMIRLATESDASFAPYSNICPISGRTAVAVDDVGKNLVEATLEHTAINSSGNVFTGGTADAYSLLIAKIKNGTTYTATVDESQLIYGLYDNYPTVGMVSTVGRVVSNNKTFTATKDCYIAIRCPYGFTGGQLEIGNTATSYEPYAHSSATIQLGQTVYGAEIDWDTGVMTVDRKYYTLTADGAEDTSAPNNIVRIALPIPSDSMTWTSASIKTGKLLCDMFKESTNNETYTGDIGILYRINGSHNVVIGFGDSFPNVSSFNEAKAWIAANTPHIVYWLDEPVSIQLTPTQLEMLKGYNHITLSDGYGTIELKALTGANWS